MRDEGSISERQSTVHFGVRVPISGKVMMLLTVSYSDVRPLAAGELTSGYLVPTHPSSRRTMA
jgi:hypothetical protein